MNFYLEFYVGDTFMKDYTLKDSPEEIIKLIFSRKSLGNSDCNRRAQKLISGEKLC